MKSIPSMDELDEGWRQAFETFLEGFLASDVPTPEQEQKLDSFLNDLPQDFGQDEDFVDEVMARI